MQSSDGELGAYTFVTGGLDLLSDYYFRGVRIERDGLIAQPWFFGGVNTVNAGWLDNVNFGIGFVGSLHSGQTGSDGIAKQSPNFFYEADPYATITLALPHNLEVAATYFMFTSPNESFATGDEISLQLKYDDSGLWDCESFGGLQPSLLGVYELRNQYDGGAHRGTFLGVGIAPSWHNSHGISLSLPTEIGLSLDNYYEDFNGEDHSFGYLNTGIVLSTPMTLIDDDLKAWHFTIGYHALAFGTTLEQFNLGQDFTSYGKVGVSFFY